jgi:phospholipid/cholesterol/gamma-HCH transport system substrate-binding protein
VGESGGGKTTLMRSILGLIAPAAGTVKVLDQDVHGEDRRAAQALRMHWGVMFQQGALFSALPVFDNVAFLLLLGCGAVFVAWWMQSGTPQTKTYRILSDSSVAGLSVDARVKYKGVDVGSVREIKLNPKDPRLILIRITLVAEAPVTHTTYVEIAKAGLTGASYLALREGKGGAEPLQTSDKNPARIPFHRSLMSKLETSGEQLISEGKDIGKRLNELLDSENRHHVSAMLAHLDKASKRFAAMEQAAMPAIRRLPALTTQANQALAESRTVLKRAAQDAESLRGLSQEIRNATDQIQHHTLPRLDQLLRGLDRTATNLDKLARELRRNPQSVLFGSPSPPPGPGEPGFQTPTNSYR